MIESLMILGRQPALGIAELESLYGAAKVQPVGTQAAWLHIDPCLVAFNRLGGTVKFCKILTTLDTTNWGEIEKFLIKVSPVQAASMPEGKMTLGLSAYDMHVTPARLNATGLSLKKAIRQDSGRSVRLVPNNDLALSSAQVYHNHLTDQRAWELIFVPDGKNKTIIAQTVRVQDIDAYTRRDRERPKRDSKVGMLPPKLAQTLINLATGPLPEEQLSSICDIPADAPVQIPQLNQTVLDPFCGTGVVLQEAALMGYEIAGSDLEPRMIDYSRHNLDWLSSDLHVPVRLQSLETGDATQYQWNDAITFIATEAYLGRPFTAQPSRQILEQTVAECNLIIKKFLQNLARQIPSGTRLCLAVPAWQLTKDQFRHLPLIDQISNVGYNQIRFEHVRNDQLLYHRENQIVARQLLVLTRR
jgi:tRNA G10  N-methylase Trm11